MRRQHGVISWDQLIACGLTRHAIAHRVATGRLYRLWRGVYAVGRREVSQLGLWMAAVLACGDGAALSHESGGQLLGFWPSKGDRIHVSVPSQADRQRPGITVHRRSGLREQDLTRHMGIPVTSPACTLTDLAARYGRHTIERAVNDADQAEVVTVPELREYLDALPPDRRGANALRAILEPGSFTLTDSDLEQLFVPLARRAGLPKPRTRERVNGFKVDFHWPELGLVVETDGGRFHRTPTQQRNDRRRDHAHLKAGMTPLRFTHHQIAHEPGYVEATLRAIAA